MFYDLHDITRVLHSGGDDARASARIGSGLVKETRRPWGQAVITEGDASSDINRDEESDARVAPHLDVEDTKSSALETSGSFYGSRNPRRSRFRARKKG